MGRRSMGMPFAGPSVGPAGVLRSAALWAVVALGATVALGGCRSEETPPGSPTPSATASSSSPSASVSPSPSPTESSDVPAAAREKTEKGAEAFVTYFVQQSAAAWTTPNARLIENLSDPDCASCTSLAKTASDLEGKGHRYREQPISVVSVEALVGDGNRQNVAATIKQHAVEVVDAKGRVVSSDAADDLERTFLLYWKGGRWLVGGIA